MKSFYPHFFNKIIPISVWICLASVCYTACSIPRYETHPVTFTVNPTPQLLHRGKALVNMMCADCHRDPVSGKLTGKHLADVPKIMGTLYSQNITQHPTLGAGTYTEGELAYLLRTGIDRQGNISPIMAKPGISDEDLQAVIAYLKHSPDEAVQPSEVKSQQSTYSLPAKIAFRVKVKPFDYPSQPIATPDITDKVAYGKYMVRILGCFDCHSKSVASVNKLHPEKTKGYMGGGMKLKGINGENRYSPNITMDKETGIGRWKQEDFVKAIRQSIRPDNNIITYPMPRYGELTLDEAEAVYAYIQTIPAIKNPVKRNNPKQTESNLITQDSLTAGRQLYASYGCKSCHGENGIGIADLRMAYKKFSEDKELIAFVKNPSAFNADSRMPHFENIIQETDFAPLLSYVRWLGSQADNHAQKSLE